MRLLTLQRDAKCSDCGQRLPAGTEARYYSAEKIYCSPNCETPSAPAPWTGPAPQSQGGLGAVQVFLDRVIEALEELRNSFGK